MAKIEVRWLWAFIALETTNSAPRLALRSLATLAHPSLWGHLYFAELGTFLFCIDRTKRRRFFRYSPAANQQFCPSCEAQKKQVDEVANIG